MLRSRLRDEWRQNSNFRTRFVPRRLNFGEKINQGIKHEEEEKFFIFSHLAFHSPNDVMTKSVTCSNQQRTAERAQGQ